MSDERAHGAGGRGEPMEARIGRLLGGATLVAMALLAIGSLVLLVGGQSPLDPAPALDPGRLPADLLASRPTGLLWLGLLLVLVTPAARVAAALSGYVRRGEREMALVAALVLAVIAAGVAAGTIGG